MQLRALVRRAFPYLVIAVAGFALAYVIVFVFVLPSRIVPRRAPSVPDSAQRGSPAGSDSLTVSPPETTLSSPVPFSPPAGGVFPETMPGTTGAVQVPDVVQMALSDALAVLHDLHLSAMVRRDTSSLQPENTVLRQSPPAGTTITPRATVALTASMFPPLRAARTGDSIQRDSTVRHNGVPPSFDSTPAGTDTGHAPRDTTSDTTSH